MDGLFRLVVVPAAQLRLAKAWRQSCLGAWPGNDHGVSRGHGACFGVSSSGP
jgi:hypothetical protein